MGPIVDVQGFQDCCDVKFYGSFRQVQGLRNFLISAAPAQQFQDLFLSGGQMGRATLSDQLVFLRQAMLNPLVQQGWG